MKQFMVLVGALASLISTVSVAGAVNFSGNNLFCLEAVSQSCNGGLIAQVARPILRRDVVDKFDADIKNLATDCAHLSNDRGDHTFVAFLVPLRSFEKAPALENRLVVFDISANLPCQGRSFIVSPGISKLALTADRLLLLGRDRQVFFMTQDQLLKPLQNLFDPLRPLPAIKPLRDRIPATMFADLFLGRI